MNQSRKVSMYSPIQMAIRISGIAIGIVIVAGLSTESGAVQTELQEPIFQEPATAKIVETVASNPAEFAKEKRTFNSVDSTSIVIKSGLVKFSKSVNVPVEQAGVLTKLLVREGQLVKKGQLIGSLKDSDLQLQLERAQTEYQISTITAESQIDIEYARKSRDVAAADLRRSEQANQRVPNTIPVARIEKQKLERDRTELQLQKAQRDFRIAELHSKLAHSDIKLAQSQLRKTQVLAPVDGMVVSIESHAGEWVEPSQTLAKIVRVDQLRIEGFVPAASARLIKSGMPVEVRFKEDWIKQSIPGKVVFVNPEANPHNMTVQIWADIENVNQSLVPGLRGDIVVGIK